MQSHTSPTPVTTTTTITTATTTALNTATNIAATLTSTFSSLQSNVISPIAKYFSTQPLDDEAEKKNSRTKRSYKNNITASLALQSLEKPKSHTAPGSTAMIMSAIGSAWSFVASSTTMLATAVAKVAANSKPATSAAVTNALPVTAPAPLATNEKTQTATATKPAPIKRTLKKDRPEEKIMAEMNSQQIVRDMKTCQAAIDKKIAELKINPNGKKAQAEIEKNLLAQVTLVEPLIKEHAARRVDLFFYLLVAVYNQKVKVTRGSTRLQHGTGFGDRGTAACHSSMFPNPQLEPKPSIPNLARASFTQDLSLDGTHFQDSLNMTTELPWLVNKLDCNLETTCYGGGKYFAPSAHTKAALVILNKASMGRIDPVEGINQFINILKTFFNNTHEKYIDPKARAEQTDEIEYSQAYAKIWDLQRRGTFAACKPDTFKNEVTIIKDTLIVDEEYINLNLGITTPQRKALHYITPLFLRYSSLQNEIFTKTPDASANLRKTRA